MIPVLPHSPVGLCGKDAEHGWSVVDLQHVGQRLQDIKIEKGVTWNRTVQSGFEKRRPVSFQHPWGTAIVVFTHTCDSGENHLREKKNQQSGYKSNL